MCTSTDTFTDLIFRTSYIQERAFYETTDFKVECFFSRTGRFHHYLIKVENSEEEGITGHVFFEKNIIQAFRNGSSDVQSAYKYPSKVIRNMTLPSRREHRLGLD